MPARVLIVDDIAVNIRLLEAKLASEYFDVRSAASGEAALRAAAAEPPDVILLDVMMPRMDGFEVCRRLKADPRTADIPVVMVTALSDTADRLSSLAAGADEFLTKPVNDTALLARVRSLVRLKRMRDEWRMREEICGRFGGKTTPAVEDIGPARVMIVDGDPNTAAGLRRLLLPTSESVHHVTAACEALDQLDGDVDLVIASLASSDDDALRLVAQCRARDQFRQLPIVLIADCSELPRLAKGLDLGANDYLVRPVDKSELLTRCATQVKHKRLQDRLDENYRRSLSLALTDELTGLYNRRYLFAHLEELIERTSRDGTGAALWLFDIDHFKRVNDSHGHAAGDEVLRQVARRALASVRGADLVARLGGEEFAVVMPETELAAAAAAAERLRAAVAAEPFVISPAAEPVAVTISIGVSETLPAGDAREGLLKRADEALYIAKAAGRDCVVARPAILPPASIGS